MPAPHKLNIRVSGSAGVTEVDNGILRLQISPGPVGFYRLAQIDDYSHLHRKDFLWKETISLQLEARASSEELPGTWGFGFWNDPFSMSMNLGGGIRKYPALPNAAWFFFASPENYLSLRDDLPGWGKLAAVFRSSSNLGGVLTVFSSPVLLAGRWFRRLWRRAVRSWIHEDAILIHEKCTGWQEYRIDCRDSTTTFHINDQLIHESDLVPAGPLGFVIWIDNQYAAFTPQGILRYGTLQNPDKAWIEVRQIRINGVLCYPSLAE